MADPARLALERALASAIERRRLDAEEIAILQAALGRPTRVLIRVKQAAFAWGVSDDTVYRWAAEGRIYAERTGRAVYVQEEKPVDRAEIAE